MLGEALARSRESPPRGFGEPPEGILFSCQRARQQFETEESNLNSRFQRPLSYRLNESRSKNVVWCLAWELNPDRSGKGRVY